MTSLYDPNHIRLWFLNKQKTTDREKIRAASNAVVNRESEKACNVHWLDASGAVIHEGWVPKSAIELKANHMKRIAGEESLKTELREWMWERGLPSDGTESTFELHSAVMMKPGLWPKLPERLKNAGRQPYSIQGGYS